MDVFNVERGGVVVFAVANVRINRLDVLVDRSRAFSPCLGQEAAATGRAFARGARVRMSYVTKRATMPRLSNGLHKWCSVPCPTYDANANADKRDWSIQ